MIIHKGINLRLKVNKQQEQILLQHVGASRWIYNQALDSQINCYKENKCFQTRFELQSCLPEMKRDPNISWLREIDSTSLQQSLKDLSQAFKNFFDSKFGNRKGRTMQFPRFKSKKKAKKSFRLQNTNDSIRIQETLIDVWQLKLNKLGFFSVYSWRERLALVYNCSKINSATVYQDSDQNWYVSLQVESEIQTCLPKEIRTTGIDLGISNPMMLADGRVASSLKHTRKLAKLQRRLTKMKQGSNNWKKMKKRIGRLHFKIKSIRKNFHHQASSQLAKIFEVITVETLKSQNMMRNRRLAKSVADEAWFQFKTFLKYKLDWAGKVLLEASTWLPSSKTCSVCGQQVKLGLQHRSWKCPKCLSIHNRDQNAAINLDRI